MKWIILFAVIFAVIGVVLYIDRNNVLEWLENYTVERIDSAMHGTVSGGSGGSGSPGLGMQFAKGVGKKLINKELGIG